MVLELPCQSYNVEAFSITIRPSRQIYIQSDVSMLWGRRVILYYCSLLVLFFYYFYSWISERGLATDVGSDVSNIEKGNEKSLIWWLGRNNRRITHRIPSCDKDPKILSLIIFLGNPITNGPRGPFFLSLSVCFNSILRV